MTKLSADQTVLKANYYAKKGEIAEARKLYELVLQTYPENKLAQKGLSAIDAPTQTLTNQDLSQKIINQLIILYNQGQLLILVEKAQALIKEYPEAFIVWNLLGAAKNGLGQLGEAAEAFKKATELNPTYADGFKNLSIALKAQGKLEEAIAACKKSLSLKTDCFETYKIMGSAYQSQGNLEEAIAAFNKALTIKPNYTEAFYNIGIVLQEQGKLDKAIISYSKALTFTPDHTDAYYNMGIALHDQGKLDEAIVTYNKALSLKPEYAEVYYNMGNALQKQGKLDEAINAYESAILYKPNYAGTYNNIGVALNEQGKSTEALETYKKALRLNPFYLDAARNMLKLTVGKVDQDGLNLCEKLNKELNNKKLKQSNYCYFQANLLKHKGHIQQSFNKFCDANKLKLNEIGDQISIEADEYTKNLNRIIDWEPSIQELSSIDLKKVFIIGPSRSGKSTFELMLDMNSKVKSLNEGINGNFLSSASLNQKMTDNDKFKNLFYQCEKKLLSQNYEIVTSSAPASAFYSDYLVDKLPNVYFVIIKRNLQDLAAEIFTNEYTNGNFYSYDPTQILRYINAYNKICDILCLRIPNRCITISFENFNQNPQIIIEKVSQLLFRGSKNYQFERNVTSYTPKSLFSNHFSKLIKDNMK